MYKVLRVISGFQDGADIAGIRAGKHCGLEVGGYMTKGCMTKSGPRPEYKELYGACELDSPDYPTRTRMNVQLGNATIRLARDWNSRGELCTLKWIKHYRKPYLDIDLNDLQAGNFDNWWMEVDRAVEFLQQHRVLVLNVAGNAFYDIEPICESFIAWVLEKQREAL